MQELCKSFLCNSKKSLLVFFFILLLSFVVQSKEYIENYNDPISYSMGDARWCNLFGTCILDILNANHIVTYNLSVIGDVFNVTMNLVTWNITDSFNVGGNLEAKNITANLFLGLANNSDKLDGIDSTQFLRSDINDTLEAYTLYPNGTNPLLLNHLVNKEFVELAVAGLEIDYFFTNATSDISGYFVLNNTDRNVSESIVESSSLSGGSNQLIFNFSTEDGLPFIFLSEGIYDAHIHLDKTGGAAQTIIPRWELHKRNSSGEFLLMESETSDIQIITTSRKFDLHSVFDADIKIVNTDRLVLKLFVDITGGGSSTIRLYMEGTTDSHFTFRTPSSVLQEIFLRRDGRNSPTEDINWGGNGITGLANITCNDGTCEIYSNISITNTTITPTLLVDHIAENEEGHNVVFDNDIQATVIRSLSNLDIHSFNKDTVKVSFGISSFGGESYPILLTLSEVTGDTARLSIDGNLYPWGDNEYNLGGSNVGGDNDRWKNLFLSNYHAFS